MGGAASQSPPWPADAIAEQADDLRDRLVELRRRIHAHPELGLDNPHTQSLIVDALEDIGIESIRRGDGGCTSVIAEVVGKRPPEGAARRVALRADTDALPLDESSREPWASAVQGRMHACGHDGHVAMLVGAAALLNANRERFAGSVRLLFQPGEEGFGGARIMIEEGALDGVDAAFAIHLQPSDDPYLVAWRSGTFLAAFDDFSVVFRGAGGHASTPHAARDPIPAIGPFVDGLSHVAARETDPHDRVVFSVTQVHAGAKENVIPARAECAGTIRSLSVEGRERARAQLRRVAAGVAQTRGLEADVDIRPGYPPTLNDAAAVELVCTSARELGLPCAEMAGAYMGAEDFSYMLERVPGAMVFLGCRSAGGGPLHSDRMKIDEGVLVSGAALHVAVAMHMLRG